MQALVVGVYFGHWLMIIVVSFSVLFPTAHQRVCTIGYGGFGLSHHGLLCLYRVGVGYGVHVLFTGCGFLFFYSYSYLVLLLGG